MIFIAFLIALLAVPVLLLLAIALGPVAVVALCAVGFGLVVFAAWNVVLAIGMLGLTLEQAAMHFVQRLSHSHAHA